MSLNYLSDWRPKDGIPYVVVKGGYLYRQNAAGYTSSVFEAELYTQEIAERHAAGSHGEIVAKPVTDFLPESYEKFFEFLERIHVLHDVVGERSGWSA